MKEGLVSIIMPAYNAENTIEKAIESVIGQTYEKIELIVINDCSTDKTEEIVEKFKEMDSRLVLLNNKQNEGVSYSRNLGIENASGEYIAFLDSDDCWKSEKLEKQVRLMEQQSAVLSYTASSFIASDGSEFSYIMQAEEKTDYKTLLRKNIISCSSAMIKTSVMKELKMPNDSMHEDYFIWLKVLKKVQYAYGINEPLLVYRLSNNSKSSNRIKSAKMIYNTYRAVDYSILVALFLTVRYSIHSVSKRYKIKNT